MSLRAKFAAIPRKGVVMKLLNWVKRKLGIRRNHEIGWKWYGGYGRLSWGESYKVPEGSLPTVMGRPTDGEIYEWARLYRLFYNGDPAYTEKIQVGASFGL